MIRLTAVAVAAFLSIGAGSASSPNWIGTVNVTESGSHVMGNPNADLKLAEYLSYTCSHCANFHQQADGPLRLAYVSRGKVSVEVRHLVRDQADLTAALLTNCGEPAKFFANHNAFLHAQPKWLKTLSAATDAQKQRWSTGDTPARLRALANDLGFYKIMQQRGYDRVATDRCLADQAMIRQVVSQTMEAEKQGVEGTPSFMLNGTLLDGIYDWASLQPKLDARP